MAFRCGVNPPQTMHGLQYGIELAYRASFLAAFCKESLEMDKRADSECKPSRVRAMLSMHDKLSSQCCMNLLQASEAEDATALRSELLRKLRDRLARDRTAA